MFIIHLHNFLRMPLIIFLDMNELSLSRVKGQSYDGASNMRCKFNGFRAPILKINENAHYVYFFAP